MFVRFKPYQKMLSMTSLKMKIRWTKTKDFLKVKRFVHKLYKIRKLVNCKS